MAENKKTRPCLRCGKPGKRDNPYLCHDCVLINDDWGSAFSGATKHDISQAETYQAKEHAAGPYKPLELGMFYKIMGRRTKAVDGKIEIVPVPKPVPEEG